MPNNFRFTKIIATLGPSTQDYETIRPVIDAGADICRLNFSHDVHEVHKQKYDAIKKIEKELGKKIPIFADLQGPKLRVGNFIDGKQELKDGQDFTVDANEALGDSTRVQLPNVAVLDALKVGDFVLVDDGKIKLQVTEKGKDFAKTKVIAGGYIKDHKGFNLPNTIIPLPILTEKDLTDLEFALKMGVDLVAVSFAQTPDDLREARKVINGRAPMIVKFEKPTAVYEHLEEMVELSDVVMIARGDLGVEIDPENVPAVQKRMIRVCREKRKPVIVATHMLESMVEGAFPTRAEVTDISNAVYECADCCMLSAESAAGKHPPLAVATMDKIIRAAEKDPEYHKYIEEFTVGLHGKFLGDAMALATADIANEIKAKAIVAYTTSGSIAINVSKHRPCSPIVAVTTDSQVAGRVGMCWGIIPALVPSTDVDKLDTQAREILKEKGLAAAGDEVVLTFGKGTDAAKTVFSNPATTIVSVIKM